MGLKTIIRDVEELFLDMDQEKNIAYVRRTFENPSEIIEFDGFTKTPLLKEEYVEWIAGLFLYVPKKYKLDITVSFDDMEGHDIEELEDISRKNLLLEVLMHSRTLSDQNSLALMLCGTGLAFILFTAFLNHFWTGEGMLHEIVFYVLDILATVPFWAAADIFFVGNREQRERVKSFKKRFNPIVYQQK